MRAGCALATRSGGRGAGIQHVQRGGSGGTIGASGTGDVRSAGGAGGVDSTGGADGGRPGVDHGRGGDG